VATSSIATEVERRRTRAKVHRRFALDLAESLESSAQEGTTIRWPSDRYQEDPAAFAREILGVEPWAKQVEILEAVRDHDRVAVTSGHKCGKSAAAAMLALWFYCAFPDSRVVMSSTTSRQVDQILWRELSMIRARGGRCVACKKEDPDGRRIKAPCPHSALIDGEIGQLARTGLKSRDFREIVGFTAREAEAVAGISGSNLLYIVDEASGVPDVIFQAIEGNRAGGAKLFMISNPTKTEGAFYDAFNSKAHLHKTIRMSSEESPNVKAGRKLIPGLATRAWVDEKRAEWGEESPIYKIRVKGEFVEAEDGKIISIAAIIEAEQRWAETPAEGTLYLSLDPAGPGGQGDESVFALRRGKKILGLLAMRGMTDETHLAKCIDLLRENLDYRERGVMVVDREGSIGSALYGYLKSSRELSQLAQLVGVRASDGAVRQASVYGRVRDELWASLAQWIREGGAIPEDPKLAREIHAPEWTTDIRGRMKATPKDELRKSLGRSPDRADAVALAVWEVPMAEDIFDDEDAALGIAVGAIDPYAGSISPWG
jgi:phage terminase large subunit